MKPNQDQTPEATAVGCDVTAHALVCVPLAAVADLRRQPGPPSAPSLPASFLRHADEQSVAGLSAVYHAIDQHGLQGTDFTHWGVLGAPRFPGRSVMLPSVKRFQVEGSWGMSPHQIPHRSLHSLSGTISQALKIHGPNYGVGGGNSAAEESVFAAVALLDRKPLPGVWVVATAQEPETALDDDGNGPPGKCVRALALALTPSRPGWAGLRLRLEMDFTAEKPFPNSVGNGLRAVPQALGTARNGTEAVPYNIVEMVSKSPAQPNSFKLFTMLEQIVRERVPGKAVTLPLQSCARLTLAWSNGSAAEIRPTASEIGPISPMSPISPISDFGFRISDFSKEMPQ